MALFVFLLMLYVSQSAAVTVKVYKGHKSVSLPFFTIPLNNDASALWSREGSRPEDVHLRDNDVDVDRQSPQFKGRTEMKPDALQTGNLSLVLKNPTASDSGTYLCVVKEGITVVRRTIVELVVISVNVTAYVDESVSLPCNMRPLEMDQDPSALWTREGVDQVHRRVNQGDDLRLQSPQFKDRTQINPDALQTGDLSLVLKKPTLKDSGTYTCTSLEGNTQTGRISVEVNIEPIPRGPWPIIRAVVGTVVLGLVGLVGVWFYRKKWIRPKLLVCEGAESVSLPFFMRGLDMRKDPSVMWTREGSTTETVHLRHDKGDEPDEQSDQFKDRTEMRPDALQTGDLSLVLKNPTPSDSGVYTCVVRERTKEVKRTSVELIVIRSTGVTVWAYEGAESVSLPFIMRGLDINKDPSALWTRGGSSPETVHLRDMKREDVIKSRTEMKPDALQTGDLSLVLKNAKASDSGTYTCVVKEGTDVKCTTVELVVIKKWKYGKRPQWNKKKHNASSVI